VDRDRPKLGFAFSAENVSAENETRRQKWMLIFGQKTKQMLFSAEDENENETNMQGADEVSVT